MALRSKLAESGRRLLSTFQAATHSEGHRWSGYLLFLPAAFACGLGVWQVQRKAWKEELLKLRLAKVFAEPFRLFDRFSELTLYDRVSVKGVFLEQKSVFVGPRVRTINGLPQSGYTLITPLVDPQRHHVVLVNRGWVPESWKAVAGASIQRKSDPERNSSQEVVEVEGLVVESENPSVFVPKNVPHDGQWFWISAPEIAQSCGLSPETPLITVIQHSDEIKPAPQIHGGRGRTIEFNASESYPVAKDLSDFVSFSVMPIDHRNYAWIWFSLSLATSLMAYSVIRKK